MSRLEKFIEDNREEFDDMAPSGKPWQQVEAAIAKKPRIYSLPGIVIKWSAVAAVLLLVSVVTIMVINKNNTAKLTVARNTDTIVTDLTKLAPEEAPEMNQVAKLIALKQEELKVLSKEQPVLYQKFAKDLTQLDSLYYILKNQLSVTPNREMLIEAMIQNLQLQLNVLNQQLIIIHQIKQSKKNSHEKNKSFI